MKHFSMDTAKKEPGSDEWWALRLAKGIQGRRKRVEELQSWLDGTPPAPWEMKNESDRAAYERLVKIASLNLAELIVSSTLYRVQVETVRTLQDSDPEGDSVVNGLLLSSDASSQFRQAIEWMLALSVSYLLVRPVEVDSEVEGRITAEHPLEVNAAADPQDPSKNVAAIKLYRDDALDRDVLVIYRQDYTRTAYKHGRSVIMRNTTPNLGEFMWDEEEESAEVPGLVENSVPGVPVFTLLNRFGVGEFEKHIPHMQRINHTILQQMILIALQSFKQRAVSGVPNADPSTGEPIDYDSIFTSDPGSLWIMPEAAKVWESGQADINPIITSVSKDVERLAIAAQAPLYALSSDAAQQAAASAELMREGQIFKAEDLQKRLSPRFAAAVSHMLKVSGDEERADRSQMRIVWAPTRRSSLMERAQAGQFATAAGIPLQTVAEKFFEMSPAEIQQMLSYRADDALSNLLNTQNLGATS